MLDYESRLWAEGLTRVAGVDEVGRGCLFGDVVAAAVILPVGFVMEQIDDSKKLSEKRRMECYEAITREALAIGVGRVNASTIDAINIKQAARLAMKRAVEQLAMASDAAISRGSNQLATASDAAISRVSKQEVIAPDNADKREIVQPAVIPEHLLIDAEKIDMPIPQTAIIKGDQLSQSIAAASIIAKVTRDNLCLEWDRLYPEYGIAIHKGYATTNHREQLQVFGPSPLHRRSFLRKLLADSEQLELF